MARKPTTLETGVQLAKKYGPELVQQVRDVLPDAPFEMVEAALRRLAGTKAPTPAAPLAPRDVRRPSFTVTPEQTPGFSSGHRSDIQSGSEATRQRYQGRAPFTRDREDLLYKTLGVPSSPQRGTGAYVNAGGDLEINPVNVMALPSDVPQDVVEAVERFRGVNTAQEAMAGNMPIPDPEGNALFYDMGRLPSREEMSYLVGNTPEGFATGPTTGGVMTFPFDPSEPGGSSQEALTGMRELARRYLGTEPGVVRNQGFYNPALGRWGDEGIVPTAPFSGEATMDTLSEFAKIDPRYAASLAGSPDVRADLLAQYNLDKGAPTTREDIQNTRQFFADPRWAEAVELIRRGAPPAAALAALGYTTSSLAAEAPPQ